MRYLASHPKLLQVLAQAARQQQEQQAKQQPPQAPSATPAVPPAQTQTVVRPQEPDPVLLYKLERVERQVGPQLAAEALRCMLTRHMPCHVRRKASRTNGAGGALPGRPLWCVSACRLKICGRRGRA